MIAYSSEFKNIVVREEEQNDLEMLACISCPLEIKDGPFNKHGKISILIQLYISWGSMDSFSLVPNASYPSASLTCIMWALFEVCLRRGWCEISLFVLNYYKSVDNQVWPHQHPLRKFDRELSSESLRKLEEQGVNISKHHKQTIQYIETRIPTCLVKSRKIQPVLASRENLPYIHVIRCFIHMPHHDWMNEINEIWMSM